VKRITISGGDPFIRSDLFDLIEDLIDHGIFIDQIKTNGLFLNKETLEKIHQLSPKTSLCISFDGKGKHDWMRNHAGLEDHIVQIAELCRRLGIPLMASMCICKENRSTLNETVSFLSSIGFESLRVSDIINNDNWSANGNSLTVDEMVDVYKGCIAQFFKDGSPIDLDLGAFFHCRKGSKNVSIGHKKLNDSSALCQSIIDCKYVSPNGDVFPCVAFSLCDIDTQMSNVKNDFSEIVNNRYGKDISYLTVKDLKGSNDDCSGCEFLYKCGGGCRANAVLSRNGILGKDPVACAFYRHHYNDLIDFIERCGGVIAD